MGHSTSPKWPTTALDSGANRTWQPHGDPASVGPIFIPSFIHSHRLPHACLQPAGWHVYYSTVQMRSLRFVEGMLGLLLLSISLPFSLSPLIESLLYAKLSEGLWKVLNVKHHHCLVGGEATNVKAT